MRLFRSPLLALAGIAALIDAHPNHKILQAPVVFAHVNLIDTANSSLQPDMNVVIVGDHITDVGNAKDTKVPSTGRIIDGQGKFLIRGLWDMHVHTFTHDPHSTRTWFFPLFIANGITGVRDMWTNGRRFFSGAVRHGFSASMLKIAIKGGSCATASACHRLVASFAFGLKL